MVVPEDDLLAVDPAEAIGGRDGFDLLRSLVSIAPTNLEDPLAGRYEKPNYGRAAEELTRWARRFGLSTRRFDPIVDLPPDPIYRGVARPNVLVDLAGGDRPRLLILAHYDVVPVPAQQLAFWKSPPHTLTRRADGRLYARGANDDLGSGVVASLLALKRLAASGDAPRPVRLLLCCDEETGGLGGIEAMRRHDAALPEGSRDRFLDGSVALIPDGSPHATAASSGLIFVDGRFVAPATTPEVVKFGQALIGLDARARTFRSVYPSPDWPSQGAPEPVITGRATLTRFDLRGVQPVDGSTTLVAAHAENEAPNQIAAAVTLGFAGPPNRWEAFVEELAERLPKPYRIESPPKGTSLPPKPGVNLLQVVGRSSHAGYPHRALNPVPAALTLLDAALRDGLINPRTRGEATFSVDLRLIPEMAMEGERAHTLAGLEGWARSESPNARVEAPPSRARGGYALPPDHPAIKKLERIMRSRFDEPGVFGEYGGTDASSLLGLRASDGGPLPALVFGSMDRAAHIHEAEESADPRLIARVSETIEAFAREP